MGLAREMGWTVAGEWRRRGAACLVSAARGLDKLGPEGC